MPFIGHSAYAVDENGTCVLNSDTTAEQCNANLYCRGTTNAGTTTYSCTKCPDSHPYSAMGADSQTECYKNCQPKEIKNGTQKPDSNTVSYNKDCTYTNASNITCNNTTDECAGFHLVNGQCISNKQNCTTTNASSGIKVYVSSSGEWSDCYPTSCETGYHLENIIQKCGVNSGTCVSDTKFCNSETTLTTNCKTGETAGQVSGTITWDTTNTKWDYSNCKCTRQTTIINGDGTETCDWNNNWTNCIKKITKCNAGYFAEGINSNQCITVKPGYYSPADQTQQLKCPIGATSDAGATDIKECYINNQTQFCDNNDICYTIPGTNTKIYYRGGI